MAAKTAPPRRDGLVSVAALQCYVWAIAATLRIAEASRLARRRLSDEEGFVAQGEAMLALITLERALEAARWVVANRDDAADRLNAVATMNRRRPNSTTFGGS